MSKIETKFSPTAFRAIRIQHGSRTKVAQEIGLNYFTIASWEQGIKRPRVDNLRLLATLWRIPYRAMLEE